VKLDPKSPVHITPGEDRFCLLVAVPQDAVPKGAEKGSKIEKDFYWDLRYGGVEGVVRSKTFFSSNERIPRGDDRDRVVFAHKLERFDPKDGIVLVTKQIEPKKDAEKKESPNDDDSSPSVASFAPKGGVWIAGLAATLGLVFAGLWLARRSR
jgi:hypothetical protein